MVDGLEIEKITVKIGENGKETLYYDLHEESDTFLVRCVNDYAESCCGLWADVVQETESYLKYVMKFSYPTKTITFYAKCDRGLLEYA